MTGLQYLGKTIANPYTYSGSGLYWTSHIKKHGNYVDTEVIRECKSEEDLINWGKHYSKLWNIVESNEWANLKEETGTGGCWSKKSKQKLSDTNKKILSKLTTEELAIRNKNSMSSPKSWTKERKQKISKATTGVSKTMTPKFEAALKSTEQNRIKTLKSNAAKNKNRTWKNINGKRVWMNKEVT